MRKWMGLLGAAVVTMLGAGFLRGWLRAEDDGPALEKREITIILDADGVPKNAKKAKENTTELSGKVKEEARGLADQTRD